jgi:hypothetical protein
MEAVVPVPAGDLCLLRATSLTEEAVSLYRDLAASTPDQ